MKIFKRRSANVTEFLAEYISTLGLLRDIVSFQQCTSERTAVTSTGRSVFFFTRGLPGKRNMTHNCPPPPPDAQQYANNTLHCSRRYAACLRCPLITFRQHRKVAHHSPLPPASYINELWNIHFQHTSGGPGAYAAGPPLYIFE